jgi:glycosyltransferase involved in cell wall biosynthesis
LGCSLDPQKADLLGEENMKIGVFFKKGEEKFIGSILEYLKERHDVRVFQGKTIKVMQDIMKWSDVSFFEFCSDYAIYASQLKKVCKMIVRLHSYEAISTIHQKVNFVNIDDLIFVAPHIREVLIGQIPDLEGKVKIHVVPNGIDVSKFRFKERQKGFDIAFIGRLVEKKNIPLLFQCLRSIVDTDKRYKLHIAGEFKVLYLKLYADHILDRMDLRKNIRFHGWVNNMGAWLDDKQYVISTSVWEGCPMNILEAMSKGLRPLIHDWFGARQLFPKKYIFSTIDECKDMVFDDHYDSAEYRRFVEENYSFDEQVKKIEKIICSP